MQSRIKSYKDKIEAISDSIRKDMFLYLKDFDYTNPSNDFQLIHLKSYQDLDKVYNSQGFYIILTDMDFKHDPNQLKIGNTTAIYRGHCYKVKKRIESHLFTSVHRSDKKGTNYDVCLKIEDGINGIDIDKGNYSQYNWTVIVHKMRNSTNFIRRQAELAFDEKYTQPIMSKEK